MIDEKKLIEDLERNKSNCKHLIEILFFDGVMAIVDAQPQASQWIPCSERLPGEDEQVFITFINSAGKHVSEATFKGGKFVYIAETDKGYYEEVFGVVIAWQPLPQPYEVPE